MQPDPCAQRLAYLANELTLTAGQVLQEEFGFTQEQLNLFLDKFLYRAQKNRDEQKKST
jgi:hypothetical protein